MNGNLPSTDDDQVDSVNRIGRDTREAALNAGECVTTTPMMSQHDICKKHLRYHQLLSNDMMDKLTSKTATEINVLNKPTLSNRLNQFSLPLHHYDPNTSINNKGNMNNRKV
jgi:hypothetical protein